MGTQDPGHWRKEPLTPEKSRGTLPNIGGNSSPLFAISIGPRNPFDLPKTTESALCSGFGVRIFMPAQSNTQEGYTHTQ